MEASDAVFEQDIAGGDPFGGGDGSGEFAQQSGPIVDREGQEISPEAERAEGISPDGAPETNGTTQVASDIQGPPAVVGSDGGPIPTTPLLQREEAVAQAAEAAAAAEPAGEDGMLSGSEDPPAEDPPPAATSTSSEAPGAAAGSSKAAREPKGVPGSRKYLLFKEDGPGKFSEVTWMEKKGEMVEEGTAGAKKQNVCIARGQDEALGLGFAALGSPPEGCKLVAVAASYFVVRAVAPLPPDPRKVPLQIK